MSEISVVPVICTYLPGVDLQPLVVSLRAGGLRPIVVDDGSPVPPRLPGVDLVLQPTNTGLAAALNAGVARARERGATHVVTLDQDSALNPAYVSDLTALWQHAEADGLRPGALGGLVSDIIYRGRSVDEFIVVPEVLQSGTMFDLVALDEVGGFDESLGIDGVDSDVCLRLRSKGWDVAVAPVHLTHRVGRSRTIRILGRQVLLTRHPPFRDYYMVRNRLILIRRHLRSETRWSLTMVRRTVVAAVVTLLLDDNRRLKWEAVSQGVRDAIRDRRGLLPGDLQRRWSTEDTGHSPDGWGQKTPHSSRNP